MDNLLDVYQNLNRVPTMVYEKENEAPLQLAPVIGNSYMSIIRKENGPPSSLVPVISNIYESGQQHIAGEKEPEVWNQTQQSLETVSKKRKADVIDGVEHQSPFLDYDSETDGHGLRVPDRSPQQVRAQINKLIASGAIDEVQLRRVIGVSATCYIKYMKQHGTHVGEGSQVYMKACRYFQALEAKNIKIPPKKKVAKTTATDEGSSIDVSDIKLDGEDKDEVPVYDTCDEIRKKINAHIKQYPLTRPAFIREIAKTYMVQKKTTPKQMSDFLTKHGPRAGNASPVYYAAYVYFEKLRIKNKKPKTKFRLEMEGIWNGEQSSIWPKLGMDVLNNSSGQRTTVFQGQRAVQDKYGRCTVVEKGNHGPKW